MEIIQPPHNRDLYEYKSPKKTRPVIYFFEIFLFLFCIFSISFSFCVELFSCFFLNIPSKTQKSNFFIQETQKTFNKT
jgi:hypothetical protein